MKQQINGWKREMKLNIKSLFGNIDNKNSETMASYVENVSSLEDNPAQTISLKKRFPSKAIIIICAILAIVIAVSIIFIPSKFIRVKREALNIAGSVKTDNKTYFTIDTYPEEYAQFDELALAIILPRTQEQALKAIQYANDALGFNGSVYNKMLNTTAIMGRQSEENKKYRVTWTYHPDYGLEVTYEKK